MSSTETLEKVNILEQLVQEKDLIVHNDDFNTFDHVIDSLMKICGHDVIQAEQCTMIVHYNGKCQVKRGPFKDLLPMCTGLLERGISAQID